jgi:hypothetical protein
VPSRSLEITEQTRDSIGEVGDALEIAEQTEV